MPSPGFERFSPESALKNPNVMKLLLLANYNSVGMVFFLMFFRAMHHWESAAAIGHPVVSFLTRLGSTILLSGDAGGCVAALMRRRGLKSTMKSILFLNVIWELFDFIAGFVVVAFRVGGTTKEERIASMIWNVVFGAMAHSVQRVNWV